MRFFIRTDAVMGLLIAKCSFVKCEVTTENVFHDFPINL